MRPQFTLATCMAHSAFLAIWVGLVTVWLRLVTPAASSEIRAVLCEHLYELSPAWVPFVFLAYALGRRHLTWGVVVLFAIVEAGLIGSIKWAF